LVPNSAPIDGVRRWTIVPKVPQPPGLVPFPRALGISPDSSTLATGSPDGVIRLWDLKTSRLWKVLVGQNGATALDWSPDGKTLACSTWGSVVVLWAPATGRVVTTVKLDNDVSDLAWSPAGTYLAIRAGGLRLWHADKAELLPLLPVPDGPF